MLGPELIALCPSYSVFVFSGWFGLQRGVKVDVGGIKSKILKQLAETLLVDVQN